LTVATIFVKQNAPESIPDPQFDTYEARPLLLTVAKVGCELYQLTVSPEQLSVLPSVYEQAAENWSVPECIAAPCGLTWMPDSVF
jgi:hypothetical protein